MKKHIHKHVKKHKSKYARFTLFFTVLVVFSAIEDVIAVYILRSETLFEIISVALVLSFVFTVIGEGIDKLWKRRKRK